jgi:alginate O-acetyltransferase complex protein AlgJ
MPAPDSPSASLARRADQVLIALFLAILAVPGLGLLISVDRAQVSEAEMRALTAWPEWSWQRDQLATWPDRFQRYFNDRFAFRNALIHLQATVLWHAFHTSASDTVIAGKGDWLFYADDGGLQDYVQAETFTEAQLHQWQLTLERTRDWLASRHTRFLFVLSPDKQMIYPELMPGSLHRLHNDYRADQLLAYMRAHSSVEILDLRPALLEAKPRQLLYHHYDTHWNDRGALTAYQQIAASLMRWFPAIEPMRREDFVTSAAAPSGDRTTMLGLVDKGKASMPGLVPRRGWTATVVSPQHPDPYGEDGTVITEIRNGGTGVRAVMFRDSFASRLIPFVSEHFDRILYQWQNDFDPELVRREHPDVVIQEMVGRHLYIFVPTPELVPAAEAAKVAE